MGIRLLIRIAVCFYLFVTVHWHDPIQEPAHWLRRSIGNLNWNILVISIAGPLLVASVFIFLRRLREHPAVDLAHLSLCTWLLLVLASFALLLQVNVELIHIPQYALLTVLCYLAGFRLRDSVLLSCIGGIIDEGHQYFYLHSHW
ncbi:MAG: hypothetical protein ACPGXK_11580, partial [Phycisphaerae bacterium]